MPASKKTRILCVTSSFPRWCDDSSAPFILRLAEDLIHKSCDVTILAPHAPGALKSEVFYGVKVTRFQYLWPEKQQSVCYQDGALVNLRKSSFNKLKLPALLFFQFFSMFRLLSTQNFDVIHAHWILPQGILAVLLAKFFKLPVVVTVHGGDIFGLNSRFMKYLKKYVIENVSVVTVNSRFTAEAVGELTGSSKALYQIPMGVRVQPLSSQEKVEVSQIKQQYKNEGGPLLIFVGRLIEEKGVSVFLQAVCLISKQIPQVRAIIIGEGQDREAFELQSRDMGLNGIVNFLGRVSHERVQCYMAASDYFIGPSQKGVGGWIEAQGLTFLEAMAVGTVVIASRTGGIQESVRDGETGFLVEENSPQQIAAIVINIVQQNIDLGDIRASAYHHVEKHYSRAMSADNFAAVFQSLVT